MFTNQQCEIKDGFIKFPKSAEKIKTAVKENLAQVRIVPKGNSYIIEIVYQIEIPEEFADIKKAIAIDLGVDNLATIVNNIGLKPIVIEGKIIKSINQYYNREKARLMSFVGDRGKSNRIISLTEKRNRKIDDYLHKSSRFIIDYCREYSIDTIIIGNNPGWKQKVSIGKVNNQKFVSIPFKKLINQIKYKSEERGINVKVVNESYTSKASFLDSDNIPEYRAENTEKHTFSGRRIYRGLYTSKEGILINADCNGSYNCMRKVIPKFSLEEGIEGVGLHPVRLIPSCRQSDKGNLINFVKINNIF
jgi:putative transposase